MSEIQSVALVGRFRVLIRYRLGTLQSRYAMRDMKGNGAERVAAVCTATMTVAKFVEVELRDGFGFSSLWRSI